MRNYMPIVAETYRFYVSMRYNFWQTSWFNKIWELKIPIKLIMFAWLVWRNKVLT